MPRISTNTANPRRKPGDAARAAHAELAHIQDASAWSGIGRSTLYKRAAAGQIRLVKLGARSLVDMKSLRALMDNLPEASLRKPA